MTGTAAIRDRLREHYGGTRSRLVFRDPFELLVATMLAAQSTDLQVNKVTPALFARYPDPPAMAGASREELEAAIASVGLYRTKARSLQGMARMLLAEHGGKVPGTREELVRLPGVGRKTANVVLSQGFGAPAFAVDTHVFRTARRLGLARGRTPEAVEEELCRVFRREEWGAAHLWLIAHGRSLCRARSPLCGRCFLRDVCPAAGSGGGEPLEEKHQVAGGQGQQQDGPEGPAGTEQRTQGGDGVPEGFQGQGDVPVVEEQE